MKTKLVSTRLCLGLVFILALVSCGAPPATQIAVENTPTEVVPTETPIPNTPTPIPSPTENPKVDAQGYHAMAYDIESNKVILKPYLANYQRVLESSAWAFDLDEKAWQKRADGPPKGNGSLAYDAQSDRTILFIGIRGKPDFSGKPTGQTWAYDYNTDTWTNMEPEESPYNLLGQRMVYDSESDRIILFGGLSAGDAGQFRYSYETWAYDYDANTWTNMQPTGDIPEGEINSYPMSYDVEADRVLAWICKAPSADEVEGCAMNTYDYNSNTWERREMEPHPSISFFSDMVYDPGTGMNIFYGGASYNHGEGIDEFWGYDYDSNTWTELSSKNPPSARGWHAMVFHEQAGVIIMFGGGNSDNTFTDETWVYDPATGEWSLIAGGQ
jgi:hypothetical protein